MHELGIAVSLQPNTTDGGGLGTTVEILAEEGATVVVPPNGQTEGGE